MIEIYTDGASLGNPGPGGYAVVLKYKEHRKEISAGYRLTTNNRMELLAVIVGLEALKGDGKKVTVYSDSKYVVEAIEKGWIWNWVKKNFKDKKNKDLWLRLIDLYRKHHVQFKWLKGHAGFVENERCDQLAVQSAKGNHLLVDTQYEQSV